MFTPQEVQERTFVKAVFGGYDMASVDEFLEPLIDDYVTLYKENSVLKSKMKVLVEKLEEYRNQEESMKKTLVAAQHTADDLVAKAEQRCAQMLAEAETSARSKSFNMQQTLSDEEQRVARAKQTAQDFIASVEAQIKRHLDLLENLKKMSQTTQQPVRHAYDYEEEADAPQSPEQVAREIEHNLERTLGEDLSSSKPAPQPASHTESDTRVMEPLNPKFADLQFGRNYDPNA